MVGAVGRNGSGKDTLVRYLKERCGMAVLSLGDVVRGLAHLEEDLPTRDNLHEISQKYREKYGNDFFVKGIITEIDRKSLKKVGVTGIRTPADVDLLRKRYGSDFLLVYVQVENPEIRFARIKQRASIRDVQSYEDFLAQERAEKDLFRMNETIQRADVTIANAGTMEDFHREIDQLISQHRFFQSLGC